MNKVNLPEDVKEIIHRLEDAGYEAYAVGGCVRDSIMGLEPHDWDICTNALPMQIKSVFYSEKIVQTGEKHGTLTVVFGNNNYEITTYRIDGDYSDGRHPDKVEFVSSLRKDLSRRDFTMNAMAYNDATGIIDYFGGVDDIERKVLNCVGNPDDRFQEDALRIIRAIRFSISKNLRISKVVIDSIRRNATLINKVSYERIHDELIKMFSGTDVSKNYENISLLIEVLSNVVEEYVMIPNIEKEISEKYLKTDAETDLYVKLSLLFRFDKDTLLDVLKRLKFSNEEIGHISNIIIKGDEIYKLSIRHYNYDAVKHKVKLIMNQIDFEDALLAEQFAYILLMSLDNDRAIINCFKIKLMILGILDNKEPYKISHLPISGKDLIGMEFKEGKIIGTILEDVLDKVMIGLISADKDEIMQYITSKYMQSEVENGG